MHIIAENSPDSESVLYLIDAGPTHFTLSWNPHCDSDIDYRISGSENCGTCVNFPINTSSITCSSLSINGKLCNLSIQAGLGSERFVAASLRVLLKSKIGVYTCDRWTLTKFPRYTFIMITKNVISIIIATYT